MNTTAVRQLTFGTILSAFLLSFSTPAGADALDNWTTNQVSTNWFGLQHVAYGNGQYVAGGTWSDDGALLSSEDGLSWKVRISGNSNGLPQGIIDLKFSVCTRQTS